MSKQTTKRRSTWRKIVTVLLIALAAVVLIGGTAHTIVVVGGGSHILDLTCSDGTITSGLPAEKTDCILILGAGLWDGAPSPMLQERLDMGAALYHAGASDKILVSGDNSREDYNEVQAMEDYLVEHGGVPRECIVRDHAGFSTYDSMFRAKEIFCADSVIVVTQKYHLFRAVYDASCLGLDAYGADAQQTVFSGRYHREIRECLARVKDCFMCVFKPAPACLGDKIPINA
ncbi:MAG: YdcF family protein [Clostridia bacterium]|nr:YdcF family protein [Clostridia bacterium]